MNDPKTTQSAIMFLISVGSLAASELKERWSLKRKQQEAQLDLTQQGLVEQEAEATFRELLSQKSDIEVKRSLDLVQRKQKLIYDAQRGKLNTEEEFAEGRITLDMLQLRKERYDNQIKEKFAEIEGDLQALGISINRQPL